MAYIWPKFWGKQGGFRRLVRVECGETGTPSYRGKGLGRGAMPSPQQKRIFTWNGVFWCIVNGIFCPCPRQKNVEFSAWSGDLVDIEDVRLGNSEYSVRIIREISLLLHCNASNRVRKILKHDKILGGQFALASPTPNSPLPVIYAHEG